MFERGKQEWDRYRHGHGVEHGHVRRRVNRKVVRLRQFDATRRDMEPDWPVRIQFGKRHVVFAQEFIDQILENLSNLRGSDKTKRLDERFDNRLYNVSDRHIQSRFHNLDHVTFCQNVQQS